MTIIILTFSLNIFRPLALLLWPNRPLCNQSSNTKGQKILSENFVKIIMVTYLGNSQQINYPSYWSFCPSPLPQKQLSRMTTRLFLWQRRRTKILRNMGSLFIACYLSKWTKFLCHFFAPSMPLLWLYRGLFSQSYSAEGRKICPKMLK